MTASSTLTKTMLGLHLDSGSLTLRDDLPFPEPAKDQALIRVTTAGVCSTDLELVKGYSGGLNGVLGHEFVGVVEKATDSRWIGRRVVSSINFGCQSCELCKTEGPEHCRDRTVMGIHNQDGGFAEYVVAPLVNLHAVPDSVSDQEAVFTEPLAAALKITDQITFKKHSKIAVVGPGRLGMLIAKVLDLHGADVTVYGRSEASLELPHQWGLQTDLVSGALESHYDVTVEATGNSAGLTTSLQMVRPMGTLVLKSTFADRTTVDLTKVVVDEITIVGSRCGPFDKALHLLEKNLVPVQDLIDGSYPLSEGLKAIDHAAQKGVRKILIQIN